MMKTWAQQLHLVLLKQQQLERRREEVRKARRKGVKDINRLLKACQDEIDRLYENAV